MSGGCEILLLWQEVFRAIINRPGNFSPNIITSLKLCPSASLMSSIELSLESRTGREKENHKKNIFSIFPGNRGCWEDGMKKRGVLCSWFLKEEWRTIITELLRQDWASRIGVIGLGSTGGRVYNHRVHTFCSPLHSRSSVTPLLASLSPNLKTSFILLMHV